MSGEKVILYAINPATNLAVPVLCDAAGNLQIDVLAPSASENLIPNATEADQELTVADTAGGVQFAAFHASTTHVFWTLETGQVRVTFDGSAPTTTNGPHRQHRRLCRVGQGHGRRGQVHPHRHDQRRHQRQPDEGLLMLSPAPTMIEQRAFSGKALGGRAALTQRPRPPLLEVTSPNGGETWYKNSTHDVTFTTSPAVPVGTNFRLRLYDPTGVRLQQWISPLIPAVAGQTSYSSSWTITSVAWTPWRVRVYFYDAGGVQSAIDASNADFEIAA